MNPIEISQLRKSYGTTEVLHGINLAVSAGTLTGFLGPNGAGKSTTIRVLMGLISASGGQANLLGKPARDFGHESRAEIGYLPGEVRFYTSMTGRATLNFFAAARRRDCRQEIDRLGKQFDLDLSRTVRKYSSGMKQKLGLIQAMMHQPQLLVLDEPTNGLDPLVRKTLFQELKTIVSEKRTVLFSSHTLSEVEEICDEVIILRGGQVIEQEKISVLRKRALRRIEIKLMTVSKSPADFPVGFTLLKKSDALIIGTWEGAISKLLEWLRTLPAEDVIIQRPGLEDLFLTYYSGTDDGGAT